MSLPAQATSPSHLTNDSDENFYLQKQDRRPSKLLQISISLNRNNIDTLFLKDTSIEKL